MSVVCRVVMKLNTRRKVIKVMRWWNVLKTSIVGKPGDSLQTYSNYPSYHCYFIKKICESVIFEKCFLIYLLYLFETFNANSYCK